MKKILCMLMLVVASIAAFAGSEKVKDKWNGKVCGTVDWTYSIGEPTSTGCFTTVTATNNSPMDVSITFKTNVGGCEGMTIRAYETESVMIGTDKTPTSVHCIGVTTR